MDPKRICNGICKRYGVKKPTGKGRYSSGQGRCQICDIWISHKGAHLKDGTPADSDSLGWFCNCCNYRIRQKPRNLKYKEKLRNSETKNPNNDGINLSYFNKRRASMLRDLGIAIVARGPDNHDKNIDEFLPNTLSVVDLEREFGADINQIIDLACSKEPNKVSMIMEFERIQHLLGHTPTKQDMDKNSRFDTKQYELEFKSWEHFLYRLGYDPWYRNTTKAVPLPTFEDIMLPILKFLADERERRASEVKEYLASYFKISKQNLELEKPSRGNYFSTRISWAKTYMTRSGLLEKRPKVFYISKFGLDILQQNPSRIDRVFLRNLDKLDIRESEPSQPTDALDSLTSKALHIIKTSTDGVCFSDLCSQLEIPKKDRIRLKDRLKRIDSISIKEIKHQDVFLDYLFEFNYPASPTKLKDDVPESNSQTRGHVTVKQSKSLLTTDDLNNIVQQVLESYKTNKKNIKKPLQRTLTLEFINVKSLHEIVHNHPKISKKDILLHVRTPWRLPDELRKLNESGLHSDPQLGLHIALFATDYYEWEGEENNQDKIVNLARLIANRVKNIESLAKKDKKVKNSDRIEGGKLRIATAVWIAVATLQQKDGMSRVFTNKEIIWQISEQKLCSASLKTLYYNISWVCVANIPGSSKSHRKLYRTSLGMYRLYKRGEPYHPSREGCRIAPLPYELPSEYKDLRRWYDDQCSK